MDEATLPSFEKSLLVAVRASGPACNPGIEQAWSR